MRGGCKATPISLRISEITPILNRCGARERPNHSTDRAMLLKFR